MPINPVDIFIFVVQVWGVYTGLVKINEEKQKPQQQVQTMINWNLQNGIFFNTLTK